MTRRGSVLRGQIWRIYVGCGLIPFVALGLLFLSLSGRVQIAPNFFVVAVPVAAAGLVWAVMTVRCQACGGRLLWKAVKEQPPGDWLVWLIRLEACPICGHSRTT